MENNPEFQSYRNTVSKNLTQKYDWKDFLYTGSQNAAIAGCFQNRISAETCANEIYFTEKGLYK